jgi:alkylation response protein AidB-like acyl-CoA dehydrogenase
MLKILLGRLIKEAHRLAIELEGADILTMNDATAHYLHDFARTVGGGTDEIQHNIVAQRVLGLPRQQ